VSAVDAERPARPPLAHLVVCHDVLDDISSSGRRHHLFR